MSKKPQLFILDANALLHRAWHALPPLTTPEGMVANAVYGVMSIVSKMIEEHKPDSMVACWDTEAPTFRHESYVEYKAGRAEQPDELYAQIPPLKEGLAHLGVPSVELDGYEADDLIGTVAVRSKKEGWDVTILSSDRDVLQLVQSGIQVIAFKKGMSETIIYDAEEIRKQYGLEPEQFIDYKAMRGDTSDNIPGIKGIGEKGATDLLQKYKTLDGILKAAHDPKSGLSPSLRQKLIDGEKVVPHMLSLVTIVTDVPFKWTAVRTEAFPASPDALRSFYQKMGFKSLLKKLDGSMGQSPEPEEKKGEKKTTKKAKSEFEEVTLQDKGAAMQALEDIATADEAIVRVARGLPGSLFAQEIEGVVVGVKTTIYFFPGSLLEKVKETKMALALYLVDESRIKVVHDLKSEMKALKKIGLEIQGVKFDTMLAAYLLSAGDRDQDLVSLALRYGNFALEETDAVFRQVEAMIRSVPPLRTALKEAAGETVLSRFDIPLAPVLLKMEEEGVLVDKKHLTDLSKELTKERAELETEMKKLVGREFNPASPLQLAEILFGEMKLPTKGIKKGKTGYSTAASELEKLRGSNPIIEMIEQYRELSKMLSTYVDVLPTLVDKNGRIHTTYNQAVAATGRLSSTDPNLQNIPIRTELGRRIRRAFIAKPGYRLLSCDYSQIELRLVAAMAKDEKMLEAFRRGDDIHTATAAAIFKIDLKDVSRDQRRIAKAINFGLIFGQGPQGLSQVAGITFADAKKFIEEYFIVFNGVKRYMEETRALAHKLGYVETIFGRRRYLPEINSTMHQLRAQAERMAINMPVQGTDADLMKLAMIEVDRKLPTWSKDARMILQVHDELVFEVPEKEVEKLAGLIKETMETVEKVGVPIVVEAKSGTNWDEMEKMK